MKNKRISEMLDWEKDYRWKQDKSNVDVNYTNKIVDLAKTGISDTIMKLSHAGQTIMVNDETINYQDFDYFKCPTTFDYLKSILENKGKIQVTGLCYEFEQNEEQTVVRGIPGSYLGIYFEAEDTESDFPSEAGYCYEYGHEEGGDTFTYSMDEIEDPVLDLITSFEYLIDNHQKVRGTIGYAKHNNIPVLEDSETVLKDEFGLETNSVDNQGFQFSFPIRKQFFKSEKPAKILLKEFEKQYGAKLILRNCASIGLKLTIGLEDIWQEHSLKEYFKILIKDTIINRDFTFDIDLNKNIENFTFRANNSWHTDKHWISINSAEFAGSTKINYKIAGESYQVELNPELIPDPAYDEVAEAVSKAIISVL